MTLLLIPSSVWMVKFLMLCMCMVKVSYIYMNIWLEAVLRTQIVKRWLESWDLKLTTNISYLNRIFFNVSIANPFSSILNIVGFWDFLRRKINNSMDFWFLRIFIVKNVPTLHWIISMALICKLHTFQYVSVAHSSFFNWSVYVCVL